MPTPTSVLIRMSAQRSGSLRKEQWMGREMLVVPATLIQAQVLHNNLGKSLLPEDAITPEWADQWNLAPVVLGAHPSHRGQPISARSPEVMNSVGVGFLFRARAEDGKLKADVYLDVERAEGLQELADIIHRLKKNETVELSTGFPCFIQHTKGSYNGKTYDLIMRPAGTDHLAIFADKVGACSTDDGCGLGVNCSCQQENAMAMDEETVGRFSSAVEKFTTWANRLWSKEGEASNESDEDRRRLLHDALSETFGGPGVEIWVAAVFSDESRVVFERSSEAQGSQLLMVEYSMDEEEEASVTFTDPVKVRRITEFVPAANREEADAGDSTHPEDKGEDAAMNRQQMIAQLSENGPLSKERLAELGDEELQALHEMSQKARDAGTSGDSQEDNAAANEGTGSEDGAGEPTTPTNDDTSGNRVLEAVNALTAEIKNLREAQAANRQELAELQEVTRPAVEERERERSGLIQELAGNALVPYEEAELKAKNLEELRKLRAMARGQNYSGRGGPKVSQHEEAEAQFAEPVPYWQKQGGGDAAQEVN